jgi:hypothetical protein
VALGVVMFGFPPGLLLGGTAFFLIHYATGVGQPQRFFDKSTCLYVFCLERVGRTTAWTFSGGSAC